MKLLETISRADLIDKGNHGNGKKKREGDRMWRLLESPDDISLYLYENNCICLCAYEIGGVECGRGMVVLTVEVAVVCAYPLKSL